MEQIIVTNETQLTEIVEKAVRKILNKSKEELKTMPENISGCRAAVNFLTESGYRISLSLIQKETAAGTIPCRKFHNKHLVFKCNELIEWAEKHCQPVGDVSEITLSLASDANNKLRKKTRQ
jgi:hypothetical protein